MTFGLATISNTTAQKRSESVDSSSVEYPDSLVKERLQKQLHHRNCGLVVDPRWGNVDLIFPFATYEAKKKKKSLEDAERQLLEAGSIYLGMLDDLQRDPYQHDQYQGGIEVLLLMFGFTSSGSTVCVYIIHPAAGEFVCLDLSPPLRRSLLTAAGDCGTDLVRKYLRPRNGKVCNMPCRFNPQLCRYPPSRFRGKVSQSLARICRSRIRHGTLLRKH